MKGIPCRQMLEVMTHGQLDAIHESSLTILERTGARFDSPDARRRLLEAGAVQHPSRKDVLRIPRSVVEEALSRIPRELAYFARDSAWDIKYDGEHTFPYAGGGNPKVIDSSTGIVRHSTYADVEQFARLGDALENNHLASHTVVPNDVPTGMIELRTVEAAMRNSAKVVSHHATSAKVVDYMVKIWSCVAGGEEAFRKRPLLSLASSPSSPLTFASHVCDVLIRSAELGVPFSVIPCPVAGGTGPVTLGGSLALQNAESLAGLVLIQTVAPSLPSVYCGRVCFMDPRSGRDLWGVPEQALASAALVQLGKRYGMVCDTCGTASDVTRWDMQLGLERMMTALVPIMAGAESVSGIGDGWEGASSLEMMVIDNWLWDDLASIAGGSAFHSIEFDAEDISRLPMIDVGSERGRSPGSGQKSLSERISQDASSKIDEPLLEAAREKVKSLLKEHSPMPLDRDVEMDIASIMKDAQRTLKA